MQQNRIIIFLFVILLVISCGNPRIQGDAGSPIMVSAVIPDDGNTFEYTWKFFTLPDSSKIDRESLMFQSDQQSITFTPDIPGNYTIQVIVWHYNDKISTQIFKYAIIADSTAKKLITIDDSWLNRRIEIPNDIIPVNINNQTSDKHKAKPEAISPVIKNDVNRVDAMDQPIYNSIADSLNTQIDSMFTLQIASKKTIKEAWKIVEELIANGYDAYIQKAYIYEENQMRFRVRIGKYKSKTEAQIAAATISENRKQSIWIDFYREDD